MSCGPIALSAKLFSRNGWLDNGRKRPIPHEAPFQIAGYFYYFGHYYGACCISQIPAAERPQYQQLMALTSPKPATVANNATSLAKAAKVFGVPTLLTTAFAERRIVWARRHHR
jgi:hypothetical protein